MALESVTLWVEGAPPAVDGGALAAFLGRLLPGTRVERREELRARARRMGLLDDLALGLARAKVVRVTEPLPAGGEEPLAGEVAYERRLLMGEIMASGLLYDGLRLADLWRGLLPERQNLRRPSLIVTDRLFGTFQPGDGRYHARVSLYGLPALLSTAGLVQAPARPREYYLLKQQHLALGRDPAFLTERFRGRFLEAGDPRTTECLNGYAAQAIAYLLSGDPFCPDPDCRLFNAHWQEEVIRAQLGEGPDFCPAHAALFERVAVEAGEVPR